MKLTEREEFLADFMVQYPVADMRTMCMAVEGIFSSGQSRYLHNRKRILY